MGRGGEGGGCLGIGGGCGGCGGCGGGRGGGGEGAGTMTCSVYVNWTPLQPLQGQEPVHTTWRTFVVVSRIPGYSGCLMPTT